MFHHSSSSFFHRCLPSLGAGGACALILAALVGCQQESDSHDHSGEGGEDDARAEVQEAIAVLGGTEGHDGVSGHIRFSRASDGKVRVHGEVSGLNAGQKHAIHIHEFGDARAADATSAGGHYNPEGHEHGLVGEGMRHAGDLGNLEANDEGVATIDLTVDNITINRAHNPVLGRSVIVHEKIDDGGQPTGNAGARIAQGVIGVFNGG